MSNIKIVSVTPLSGTPRAIGIAMAAKEMLRVGKKETSQQGKKPNAGTNARTA